MMADVIKLEGSEAWDRYMRIRGIRAYVDELGLAMGKELHIFQREEQYKELGYFSFNAFLADPDVSIRRRTAYRLMRNYRKYILELSVPMKALVPVGTSKLDAMVPYVDNENIDEMLNKGATLTLGNLKTELTGVERVFTPVAWESQLREARQLARALSQNAMVPQDVREFSLDYWRQTEAYE